MRDPGVLLFPARSARAYKGHLPTGTAEPGNTMYGLAAEYTSGRSWLHACVSKVVPAIAPRPLTWASAANERAPAASCERATPLALVLAALAAARAILENIMIWVRRKAGAEPVMLGNRGACMCGHKGGPEAAF